MDKESAVTYFCDAISKSWTWGRLTKEEREDFLSLVKFDSACSVAISGTFKHRLSILQAIYYAYIRGIGYDGNNWRG